jgi:hypothetical protein
MDDANAAINALQTTDTLELGKIVWKRSSWSFILYIFLTITIGLTILNYLTSSGRPLSAIVTLVLLILIFYFYSVRWFRGTQSKFEYSGSWPPVVNMCPDYLVYMKKNGVDVCVDMIGVGKSNAANRLNKYVEGTNAPDTTFTPVVFPNSDSTVRATACQQAISRGLTWEGITNGDSCTFPTSVA